MTQYEVQRSDGDGTWRLWSDDFEDKYDAIEYARRDAKKFPVYQFRVVTYKTVAEEIINIPSPAEATNQTTQS